MRREDRQLLGGLSQVNTALPAFALRVMDQSATSAEHHALAQRLITLGQVIKKRAETLTITTTCPGETGSENVAAARALSALVDMADALDRAGVGVAGCLDDATLPESGLG